MLPDEMRPSPKEVGQRLSNDGLSSWAEQEAERLLASSGTRWLHSAGVGLRGRAVADIITPMERPYLVAAAFLHDVGKAPELAVTGVHQLDGARFLRDLGHHRLANLVAYHSEARYEVGLRGFAAELRSYEREESPVSDALTFCDVTTGPSGLQVHPLERIIEITERYGQGIVVEALHLATPHILAAVARTKARLRLRAVLYI
jgi:hypothetical protein